MLGLEHVASRGSISIEYYGRDVGIKIMPTGVKPERFLNGFGWQEHHLAQRGAAVSGDQLAVCSPCIPISAHADPNAWQVVEPSRAGKGCAMKLL